MYKKYTNESQPIHEVSKRSDVMVRMRDCVRLATDIYYPGRNGHALDGPFPCLLERTPYNKHRTQNSETADYFARRGYAVVYQDTRGRHKSEGRFTKYLDDPEDGYDTVEWIAEQAWSNGLVGTFGLSYGAHTQAALAIEDPPHLTTCFMDSGGHANAYDNSGRNSGALELRQVCWMMTRARESKQAEHNPTIKTALESESLQDWFTRIPWKRGHSPLKYVPEYEDALFDLWTKADFDQYWKQKGLCNELWYEDYADVPQVHWGSWYDPYPRTTIRNFTALSELKKGPIRLVMGPWTHGTNEVSYSGDVDFGSGSVVSGNPADDFQHLQLRWFDRWLKNIQNGIDLEAPVKVFVMGGGEGQKNPDGRLNHGGRWRDEYEWPLSRTQTKNYHFHEDGTLRTELPQPEKSPSRYLFNPENPVPTIGGNISSGADIMEGGAFDQREAPRFYGCQPPYLRIASRLDVLVFQTSELQDPVEVTGPLTVRLWASSSALDTDFTAKLINSYPPTDDYPQGFDMNITDGIIRARYRDSFESPELLTPGKIYEFTIVLYPTSNLFARGHRIRVDISSSNFPRLDVNPNTGEPIGLNRRTVIAENAIFHDAEHPSHIILPIIPNES